MIGTLHGGEIVILIIAALVILGPQRLPEYAAKLAQGVRYLRDLAEGAKGQIKAEFGPGFEDIDWRQLDPRQYDPRRIVREALTSPPPAERPLSQTPAAGPPPSSRPGPLGRALVHDPGRPTPFDIEAT